MWCINKDSSHQRGKWPLPDTQWSRAELEGSHQEQRGTWLQHCLRLTLQLGPEMRSQPRHGLRYRAECSESSRGAWVGVRSCP